MKCLSTIITYFLLASCASPALERYEAEHRAMGTSFQLVLYAENADQARLATNASWERLDELDSCLSDYQPESELSQLSRSGGAWVPCSPDLWRVLLAAREMSRETAGAFDISVGPLVQVWRRAMRQQRWPGAETLNEARAQTQAGRLEFDIGAHRVRLQAPGARLDLGGIAKGDALDQILHLLAARGIECALVEGGGDIAMGTAPPHAQGWQIGLASPDGVPGDLMLERCAIATSGSAFRYLEHAGVRYSHIVDPTTGIGVVDPAHVSVLAHDGSSADAAATALSVMGVIEGLKWVEARPGFEACWWPAQNQGMQPCTSSGFPLRLVGEVEARQAPPPGFLSKDLSPIPKP